MSALPLLQVDAFADGPFTGNPAAVVLLDGPREAAWMQAVAAEMNLSETAFIEPRPDGFGLRWFTPEVEVALCGHATLASAHALWETGRLPREETARFHTRSGLLTAALLDARIELDFPQRPAERVAEIGDLPRALGAAVLELHRSSEDWLALLDSEAVVRALAPDFPALRTLGARGVIVTAAAAPGSAHHFVSRFFGAGVGIDEDPVTGSAHCVLAPFWGARLGLSEMIGYQASRRGGTVGVALAGERVKLTGRAVTRSRGEHLC
ncbi:MAG: PhzF family phenazine biosynthesis protein [Polyangiaceae bacterium]